MRVHRYKLNRDTDSNPGGNNEVHKDTCPHYDRLLRPLELGEHASCRCAIELAKAKGYENADGCRICNPECNTD